MSSGQFAPAGCESYLLTSHPSIAYLNLVNWDAANEDGSSGGGGRKHHMRLTVRRKKQGAGEGMDGVVVAGGGR